MVRENSGKLGSRNLTMVRENSGKLGSRNLTRAGEWHALLITNPGIQGLVVVASSHVGVVGKIQDIFTDEFYLRSVSNLP